MSNRTTGCYAPRIRLVSPDIPIPGHKRPLLARLIFMLLMALTFHVCGTVLAIIVIIQLSW